ncbi:MAG: hypothetical protein ACKO8I_17200 [Cyanobacteriota bacterium]
MSEPTEALTPQQLQALPIPSLFGLAFGAEAQRQRLEQREREQRQRQQEAELERRQGYLASLRDPAGGPDEAES